MHCLFCKAEMQIREGKFGPFYYCPKGNHGTISVNKYKRIMRQRQDNIAVNHDTLMFAIERHTMTLGGGVMSDLERFYIDNDAYYDNQDDFWQNSRPY